MSAPGDKKETVPALSIPIDKPQPRWVFGKSKSIADVYFIDSQALGEPGAFGFARKVMHKETKQLCACKIVDKYPAYFKTVHPKEWLLQLRAEVDFLRSLDHPLIVKFIDCFEDERYLYIVCELCTGGELFHRIAKEKNFAEPVAFRLFRQMLEAVNYIHGTKKLIHLDLKPDNFLFANDTKDSPLKLIDFGMSKWQKSRPDKYHRKPAGTPFYMAPEVLTGQYYESCDMWSLGVILYVLLVGIPPFYASKKNSGSKQANELIKEQIKKGFEPVVKPGHGPWFPQHISISDLAKDLIARLLEFDPAKRLTAAEALEHPCVTGNLDYEKPMSPMVLQSLRTFTAVSRFKEIVLKMMVDVLTKRDVQTLQRTFTALDTNGDGVISVTEFKSALSKPQWSYAMPPVLAAEMQDIMQNADVNGDGVLQYEELLMACVHRRLLGSEERLWTAFRRMDTDQDGHVTARELEAVLEKMDNGKMIDDSKHGPEHAVKSIIAEVDGNSDGAIDYQEFLVLWKEMFPGMKQSSAANGGVSPSSADAIMRDQSTTASSSSHSHSHSHSHSFNQDSKHGNAGNNSSNSGNANTGAGLMLRADSLGMGPGLGLQPPSQLTSPRSSQKRPGRDMGDQELVYGDQKAGHGQKAGSGDLTSPRSSKRLKTNHGSGSGSGSGSGHNSRQSTMVLSQQSSLGNVHTSNAPGHIFLGQQANSSNASSINGIGGMQLPVQHRAVAPPLQRDMSDGPAMAGSEQPQEQIDSGSSREYTFVRLPTDVARMASDRMTDDGPASGGRRRS